MIGLGGLIALANLWTLHSSRRTGRFQSPVPLLGAALLGAGLFQLPATRPYCWAAAFLDYGTLALLPASPRIFQELWDTSRFNLVCEYRGEEGIRTARLRLFRRGVFTLRLRLRRPPGEPGLVDAGMIGAWRREGPRLLLQTGAESAVFYIEGGALRQSRGFPSWEASLERSLAGMEFARSERGRGKG